MKRTGWDVISGFIPQITRWPLVYSAIYTPRDYNNLLSLRLIEIHVYPFLVVTGPYLRFLRLAYPDRRYRGTRVYLGFTPIALLPLKNRTTPSSTMISFARDLFLEHRYKERDEKFNYVCANNFIIPSFIFIITFSNSSSFIFIVIFLEIFIHLSRFIIHKLSTAIEYWRRFLRKVSSKLSSFPKKLDRFSNQIQVNINIS